MKTMFNRKSTVALISLTCSVSVWAASSDATTSAVSSDVTATPSEVLPVLEFDENGKPLLPPKRPLPPVDDNHQSTAMANSKLAQKMATAQPWADQKPPQRPVNKKSTVNVNSRYTAQQHVPKAKHQRQLYIDPLTVYMRTEFPQGTKTIRQAINYILEPTGYRLTTNFPAPSESALLVDKALPPVAKFKRTMPVIDILQTLVGRDHYLIIDRTHRLVSFQNTLTE